MMKVQTTELPGNEIGSKHILHLRKKYYTIPNFVRTGIDSTISNSHPNIILSVDLGSDTLVSNLLIIFRH